MVNRTFTIAEMGFATLVGHFDVETGTLRFAVIVDDGVTDKTIWHTDDFATAVARFDKLTQPGAV